jgi:hypothetical protein
MYQEKSGMIHFCIHLVHFSGFGVMHQEKSGNPAQMFATALKTYWFAMVVDTPNLFRSKMYQLPHMLGRKKATANTLVSVTRFFRGKQQK